MTTDHIRTNRRELLRTGLTLGVGSAFASGHASATASLDRYYFYDGFEDGDYTSNPAWTIYQPEGDFAATVLDRASPDDGSKVLNVSETTGSGTHGVIGWEQAFGRWDGEWTIEGLFYTENVPLDSTHQGHNVGLYYDPTADYRPLAIKLGFRDGNGNPLPFKIFGDAIDSVERTYDPDWQENTWYRYRVSHDGSGTYTGYLWEDGTVIPAVPNARSVGSAPGTNLRVGTIELNGAHGRAFDVQHAFLGWGQL